MPTPNLDTAIRHEIDQFVSNLTTLVRQAALDAVKEALGATTASVAAPPRRGPGRPRKNKAAPTPGRRTKRSSADVEAVANQVLSYVKANPGSRLEEIGRGMGVETAGLKRPIQGLIAAGALRTEGQKRGTKYLPESGAAVPAKAKATAKATRKKAGKRNAAEQGKKATGRAKKR